MIKLSGGLYITADSFNVILNDKKKSSHRLAKGDEVDSVVGYYRTLRNVITAAREIMIRKNIAESAIEKLDVFIDKIAEADAKFINSMPKISSDFKKLIEVKVQEMAESAKKGRETKMLKDDSEY